MKSAIKSQYIAALKMLKEAIEKCDEALWYSNDYKHQFWWVAYHTLFYADYYLSAFEESFTPWEKHIPYFEGGFESADPLTIDAANLPDGLVAYCREDLLDYINKIIESVEERIEQIDFEAPSGFSRLAINKFELQLYNIRHIQHHTGQLNERVREKLDQNVKWVGW